MTEESLHGEGGTRLTITPEPGYTVTCGFDSPDDMDWGETLWVWSEKDKVRKRPLTSGLFYFVGI